MSNEVFLWDLTLHLVLTIVHYFVMSPFFAKLSTNLGPKCCEKEVSNWLNVSSSVARHSSSAPSTSQCSSLELHESQVQIFWYGLRQNITDNIIFTARTSDFLEVNLTQNRSDSWGLLKLWANNHQNKKLRMVFITMDSSAVWNKTQINPGTILDRIKYKHFLH